MMNSKIRFQKPKTLINDVEQEKNLLLQTLFQVQTSDIDVNKPYDYQNFDYEKDATSIYRYII